METEEIFSHKLSLLANPLVRRIIFKLYEKPIHYGETVKELIRGTGATIGNYYYTISKLQKYGIIRKTGERGKMYEITEDGINVCRILMVFYDLLVEKGENHQEISKFLAELSEKTKGYRPSPQLDLQHKIKKDEKKSESEVIMEIMKEYGKVTENELLIKFIERTGGNPDITHFDRLLQILKGRREIFVDKNGCWCLGETQ